MDETRQIQRLLDAACAALQLPPDLLLSEWADKYRYLSSEASAKRGPWKTLPYQKEPLDVLSPSHPCQIAVYRCASQIMKTEILLCLLGYVIHMDPGPALFVEPRTEDAKALSKDRVAPMLRDTPALQGKVARARSRTTDNTTLHKTFTGGHVTFTGAISPSGLAMRPVRYLFLDEINRYPISAGTEGDPVSLAIRRTDTFDLNKKIAIASTPTGKDGNIDRWYEISDQREYHVPCPECGEYQILKFDRLRWEKGEAKLGETIDAQYECAHCQFLIPHYRKAWMVAQGRWVAKHPTSNIPGFQLSQLYALHRSWGQIVEVYLAAERNVETEKTFRNTVLAESWEERSDAPDYEKLMSRRSEEYRLGQVPADVLFLTAGVDFQKTWIEGYVWGWGRRGQRWVIDHFRIDQSPYTAAAWDELTDRLNTAYAHPGGVDLSIVRMAVDTGHATQEVYAWARQNAGRVIPVDGRATGAALVGTPAPVDVTVGGRKIKRGIKIWPVNVNMAKSELYGLLSKDRPEGEIYPHGWVHFAKDLQQEFFQQLTAEHLSVRLVKGYQKYEWLKTRDRNEALDCAVYARAAAAAFGVDRFSEHRWCELESYLATPKEVAEQVRAQAPMPATAAPAQQQTPQPQRSAGWLGETGGWFSR